MARLDSWLAACCGDGQDALDLPRIRQAILLTATKLACLLPRAGRADAEWPTPEAALAAATGGAVPAPGARADLIAVALDAPAFAAARPPEVVAPLIFAARPADIRHMVGGRALPDAGRGADIQAAGRHRGMRGVHPARHRAMRRAGWRLARAPHITGRAGPRRVTVAEKGSGSWRTSRAR